MYSYENISVIFSILVAAMASHSALTLAARIAASGRKNSATYWITGGALAFGTALWALYFLGALAYEVPVETSYDIPVTVLALVMVMIICGFSLYTHAAELSRANALLQQQINERMQAERSLREGEERYRQLVELSPDAIFICSDERIAFASGASAGLLGTRGTEPLVGRPLLELIHPESRDSAAQRMRELIECSRAIPRTEEKLVRVDGTALDVELTAAPFTYKGRPAAQMVVRDISERKAAEARLKQLAQYDSLTGLPNRALFRDRLENAVTRGKRHGLTVALIMLDLDHFKEINDTLGHGAGDNVLQGVASALSCALRKTDTVARLGGDEFTVILEDLAQPEHAETVMQKIQRALSAPIIVDGREIFVTASMGVATYPACGENIDELLQTADIALYRAKEEGRNTYEFYTPQTNAHTARRLDMENLLRRALEREEFALHYQPKVNIESGRITGAEALLRWNCVELGPVSPAEFIPIAEKTGLIVPIGEWVMRTACAQNSAWRAAGHDALPLSVNLSPRQFRERNLVQTARKVLHETAVEAHLLELEITETMIMVQADKATAILRELHELGIPLSVDDFGTGYSSLAHLKRFPVQKLKIDKSFTTGIVAAQGDNAIVAAIVALAKSLGLGVIAEGVETKEQLEYLAHLRCTEYQGYYFSKPLPADEFSELRTRAAAAWHAQRRLLVRAA